MIWNLLQLLLEQSPLFWIMVGSFFFVVGVLWANAIWGSFRVRLMDAESEQLFLIAEREQAFEAREQRKKQQDARAEQGRPILRFDKGEQDLLGSSSPQTDSERTT